MRPAITQVLKSFSCFVAALLATFSNIGSASAQEFAGAFDYDQLPVLKAEPDFNGVDPASGTYPTQSPFTLAAPGAGNLSSRSVFNGRRRSQSLNVYLDDNTFTAWGDDVTERHIRVHAGGQDKLFTCLNVPSPNVVCTQVADIDGSQLA